MRPHQLRSDLRASLLSTIPEAERESVMLQLETIAKDKPVDVVPAGSWVGRDKDTLCAFIDDQLLGALVIQSIPFLDPLILRDNIEHPALVLEFLRLRAEGILMASKMDEYRISLSKELMPLFLKYVLSEEASLVHGDEITVLRRLL